MTQSRRQPTSPYLLRRLRSYEEAQAEQTGMRDQSGSDGDQESRLHNVESDRNTD